MAKETFREVTFGVTFDDLGLQTSLDLFQSYPPEIEDAFLDILKLELGKKDEHKVGDLVAYVEENNK